MGASFCGSLSFFLLFFAARMQEEAPPRVCFGETRSGFSRVSRVVGREV